VQCAVEFRDRSILESKFGGDQHLALERLQSLSHDVLVGVRAIKLCISKKSDPLFHSRAQNTNGLFSIWLIAITMAESHTAKSDRRNFQASEFSLLHVDLLLLSEISMENPEK
jgi:hypothetical protein